MKDEAAIRALVDGFVKAIHARDLHGVITTQYGGNPYQRLVDTGRLAQQKGIIRGILLHQGESNANDKAWPTKVAKIT